MIINEPSGHLQISIARGHGAQLNMLAIARGATRRKPSESGHVRRKERRSKSPGKYGAQQKAGEELTIISLNPEIDTKKAKLPTV